MKRALFLLLAAACCSTASFAQQKRVELSTGYNAGMPQGSLGHHTATLHAINLRLGYILPGAGGRASAGIELNGGNYASYTKRQPFVFNGSRTMMDVDYSSSVTSVNAGMRYDLIRSNGFSVFGGLKGGFAYFSSDLNVQDPQDVDGCHPVQTRNLIEDVALQAGAETGVNVDFNRLFPHMPENTLLLQVHTGFTAGGRVDYINVDKQEEMPQPHQHGTTPSGDNGTPIMMRFVNTGTGEQHSHQVAQRYNSAIRYWNAGVSLVVRF